MLLNLLL